MAKTYSLVVGVVLLLVGILGFLFREGLMGLQFHLHHNLIHLLSGAIGLWAGTSKNANAPRLFAMIFGAVYTLVAIWGFLGNENLGPVMLNLNTTYNVVHVVVGLWGLIAGFTTPKAAAA